MRSMLRAAVGGAVLFVLGFSENPPSAAEPVPMVPAAIVRPGQTTIQGGLSANAVVAVIRRGMGAIRSCYQRALKRNPVLAGDLVLVIRVGPTGQVEAVRPIGSLPDEVMKKCLVGYVSRWRFPRPSTSNVTIHAPFSFRLRAPSASPGEGDHAPQSPPRGSQNGVQLLGKMLSLGESRPGLLRLFPGASKVTVDQYQMAVRNPRAEVEGAHHPGMPTVDKVTFRFRQNRLASVTIDAAFNSFTGCAFNHEIQATLDWIMKTLGKGLVKASEKKVVGATPEMSGVEWTSVTKWTGNGMAIVHRHVHGQFDIKPMGCTNQITITSIR